MSSKNKKVLDKNALRNLMKQQKETSVATASKIDSPLAKVDKLGNIFCALCGVQSKIKNHLLWNAHVLSRTHKENVAALKTSAAGSNKPSQKVATQQPVAKRKTSAESFPPPSKLPKSDSTKTTPSKPVSSLIGYGDSDDDDSDDDESTSPAAAASSAPAAAVAVPSTSSSLPAGLPEDFFDEKATAVMKPMAEVLPEGFFDDPKADAKAREIVYKPKIEEEWELFQKQLTEETKVSEAIKEEDDENVQKQRDIEEIDEQIFGWSKVEDLHKKKEQVMQAEAVKTGEEDEEEEDVDIAELEDALDWRTKKSTFT